MISLDVKDNQIAVTVMGQFTLDDTREFEQAVCYGIQFQGTVNLLFDLRDMLSYSLDVAWEELKFSREHKNDFDRLAILTGDQWVAWSMWINRLFMAADIRLFDDLEMAQAWVAGGELRRRRADLARRAEDVLVGVVRGVGRWRSQPGFPGPAAGATDVGRRWRRVPAQPGVRGRRGRVSLQPAPGISPSWPDRAQAPSPAAHGRPPRTAFLLPRDHAPATTGCARRARPAVRTRPDRG